MTRAYFHGESLNETDPLLMSIEDAGAARHVDRAAGGEAAWRMDIRLQGDGETVFLDV